MVREAHGACPARMKSAQLVGTGAGHGRIEPPTLPEGAQSAASPIAFGRGVTQDALARTMVLPTVHAHHNHRLLSAGRSPGLQPAFPRSPPAHSAGEPAPTDRSTASRHSWRAMERTPYRRRRGRHPADPRRSRAAASSSRRRDWRWRDRDRSGLVRPLHPAGAETGAVARFHLARGRSVRGWTVSPEGIATTGRAKTIFPIQRASRRPSGPQVARGNAAARSPIRRVAAALAAAFKCGPDGGTRVPKGVRLDAPGAWSSRPAHSSRPTSGKSERVRTGIALKAVSQNVSLKAGHIWNAG